MTEAITPTTILLALPGLTVLYLGVVLIALARPFRECNSYTGRHREYQALWAKTPEE